MEPLERLFAVVKRVHLTIKYPKIAKIVLFNVFHVLIHHPIVFNALEIEDKVLDPSEHLFALVL